MLASNQINIKSTTHCYLRPWNYGSHSTDECRDEYPDRVHWLPIALHQASNNGCRAADPDMEEALKRRAGSDSAQVTTLARSVAVESL